MADAFTSYKIADRSYVAFLKREIHNKISALHFNERQVGEIDIIVSEMTSNLVKHARAGEILYKITSNQELSTLEIVCIDNGPGMADTSKMLMDGVSTTGTLGQGLGALKRLSTRFQIYSLPGWGTVLYVAYSSRTPLSPKQRLMMDTNAICVSKPSEAVCGDGYRIKNIGGRLQIFFADGLGHGVHAKEAVDKAGDFFQECKEEDPADMIRQIHDRVRKTRGLVATLACLDPRAAQWTICGVGNVFTRVYSGITSKIYMGYNGALGLTIPNTMKASVFEAEKNQLLIMCSDGIRTRWELVKYPSIQRYDSVILAAALYKDFSRGTDDSSVLVAKINSYERGSTSKAG